MMDKQVGIIYETQDYSMFKHLEGNRTDAVARGAKIIKSIRKNGYILSPIAINENAEVIDGQGRLYALECEDLPVHYYVVPGAGIDECIAMNIYGTKWKMNDYIESYASRGKQPYIVLKCLMDKYKMFEFDTILTAATSRYGYYKKDEIRNGMFEITEEEYAQTVARLDYCKKAYDAIHDKVDGRVSCIYRALIFLFDQCPGDFDRAKIITKMELLHSQIGAIADIQSALKTISEIYNYRSKAERMYFDVEYDKYMCANRPGYAGKWSKAKG